MVRILHYIDTAGPGGAETVFAALVKGFSRQPYESVAMIAADGWLGSELRASGVPYVIQDSRGSFNLPLLTSLWRHVRRNGIDLIQTHFLGPAVYGALVGVAAKVPIVATFHGSVDIAPDERFLRAKASLLRRCASVVSVSESLQTELAQRLSIEKRNIFPIPNGIDTQRFVEAKPSGLRARLGIAPAAMLIGSLGNVRPAKDYARGLLAVARVIARGVDAHWAIAGEANVGDELVKCLERQAVELGISNRVHFLGFLKEPRHFLADIDIYFLCSKSEGHPLALMQAMASGRPAVIARCGVERLFDSEEYASFVNAGDDEAMASALLDLQRTPERAMFRAERAKQYVRTHFDESAMIAKYSSLYERILTGKDV